MAKTPARSSYGKAGGKRNKLAAVLEEMTLASNRNDTHGNDPDFCSASWSWIIRFYNDLAFSVICVHNPFRSLEGGGVSQREKETRFFLRYGL